MSPLRSAARPAATCSPSSRRMVHPEGPGPPIPWRSALPARSRSGRPAKRRATVASSRASSASTAGRCSGRTASRSSSSMARRRRTTWIAEPPYSRISVTARARSSLPVLGGQEQSRPALLVPVLASERGRSLAPIQPHEVLEVVEHLHRGGGSVDRGRECHRGDVDHDAEGEGGILLDRPLDPEREPTLQLGLRRERIGHRSVHFEQRRSRRDEVAHRLGQDEQAVLLVRPADEAFGVDRLDRPAGAAADDERGRSGGPSSGEDPSRGQGLRSCPRRRAVPHGRRGRLPRPVGAGG